MPPQVIGQADDEVRIIPEGLQGGNERFLQFLHIGKHAIGEPLTELSEDLFRWIEFGAVGGKIEGRDARWPDHGMIFVAGCVIEGNPYLVRPRHGAQ